MKHEGVDAERKSFVLRAVKIGKTDIIDKDK